MRNVHDTTRLRDAKCWTLPGAGITDCHRLLQVASAHSSGAQLCIAFFPFRAADYAFLQRLAWEQQTNGLSLAQDRAEAIRSAVQPSGHWQFEALDGSQYECADAQALQAAPALTAQAVNLYTTFLAEALQAAGQTMPDSAHSAVRAPFFYAQPVCTGKACEQLSASDRSDMLQLVDGARGALSCAMKPQQLLLPSMATAMHSYSLALAAFAPADGAPTLYLSTASQQDARVAQRTGAPPHATSMHQLRVLFAAAPAPPFVPAFGSPQLQRTDGASAPTFAAAEPAALQNAGGPGSIFTEGDAAAPDASPAAANDDYASVYDGNLGPKGRRRGPRGRQRSPQTAWPGSSAEAAQPEGSHNGCALSISSAFWS